MYNELLAYKFIFLLINIVATRWDVSFVFGKQGH